MWISKKKFKEMQDLINEYRTRRDQKLVQVKYLERELENKQKIFDSVITQNELLIEWIEKIVNEVGCYEVKSNESFRIPLIKREIDSKTLSYNDFNFLRTEIQLPQITIITNTRKEE